MEMTIGIIADERAVAEANPRWITMRNAAMMAINKNTVADSKENALTNT